MKLVYTGMGDNLLGGGSYLKM